MKSLLSLYVVAFFSVLAIVAVTILTGATVFVVVSYFASSVAAKLLSLIVGMCSLVASLVVILHCFYRWLP